MKKYMELYKTLRTAMEERRMPAGSRLPSKRVLAEQYGCSLSTVENALSLLEEEDWIRLEERRGAFVLERKGICQNQEFKMEPLEEDPPKTDRDPLFPVSAWSAAIRTVLLERPDQMMMKSPAMGSARLRNAIAGFLVKSRNMQVQPGQIIIGSGAAGLYETIIRLFGDQMSVALEDPGYPLISRLYKEWKIPSWPLPLKEDGLDSLALKNCPAQFLHVTPFSSYPTRVSASHEKRKEYLDWIHERKGYLIEDDIYSEFMQGSEPLPSLYSMDDRHQVIYMNTFSGSMFPSLRMGYLVLPESLLEVCEEKISFLPNSVPMLEQLALAEFIENGGYEKLLNRRRHRARMQRKLAEPGKESRHELQNNRN